MSRSLAIRVFVVCSLVPLIAFAQKPVSPGPPSTAPQVLVDSTGKTVGDVIQTVGGLSSAYTKYVVNSATGDYVVLIGRSEGLSAGPAVQLAPIYSPDIAQFSPHQNNAFFKETDCSGAAYVFMPSTSSQLTRYQALIIAGAIPTQLPPPPAPDPSCPLPYGLDVVLYTRLSSDQCPVFADIAHSITFGSVYALPNPGLPSANGSMCVAPPGGFTFGGANPANLSMMYGNFSVYQRFENFSLKFTPPYSVK